MQKTKGNYFLTWAPVIHHHSVANHHSSKFGKVMDYACLSSTILLWPLFWEFLQLFYLHFVEYFFGLVFLLGFFTYVEKKSEGRCIHEGFFFFFCRPDPQGFGTPKSSSVAEGRQDFHLHTTGFGTQTLFRGPGVPERGYTTKPLPLGCFHKVFCLY